MSSFIHGAIGVGIVLREVNKRLVTNLQPQYVGLSKFQKREPYKCKSAPLKF